MTGLDAIDEGLWVARADSRFMGLQLGTRMSVVRVQQGVILYSPVPMHDAIRGAVEDLGEVKGIIAPNLYHHLYMKDWADAFPSAKVFAARGLARKRKDLRIDGDFDDAGGHPWSEALPCVSIHGTLLRETVMLHPASRTVLSCDLLENYQSCPHWGTRQYIKLMGMWKTPGLPRWLRLAFRDRAAARASIDRVLEWDFGRLVVAHGDVVQTDGRAIVRDTYHWLGERPPRRPAVP